MLLADSDASQANSNQYLENIVKGVIEGETRVLVSSMTMEEIFTEREEFKRRIFRNIQGELDQFGLKICKPTHWPCAHILTLSFTDKFVPQTTQTSRSSRMPSAPTTSSPSRRRHTRVLPIRPVLMLPTRSSRVLSVKHSDTASETKRSPRSTLTLLYRRRSVTLSVLSPKPSLPRRRPSSTRRSILPESRLSARQRRKMKSSRKTSRLAALLPSSSVSVPLMSSRPRSQRKLHSRRLMPRHTRSKPRPRLISRR